ncbi:MAG TPA: GDP-mannose 4,6-dehydratase [Gemmataceae bacterium]|nr:GDP-mannose 4,6-dehydratase [Gemmataceae bacterium]
MPTCLVTGGAGFIGSHLVEALLATGRRVLVLDDLSTGTLANLEKVRRHPHLELVIDSITNVARLEELVERADEVYHLAAVVGVRLVLEEPERTVATHVAPTERLLQLTSAQRKPLFLASTSEVYGKNPKLPLGEEDDLVLGPASKGRWIYACSKALDEYLALSYHKRTGLPMVVGRFFNVVGPRQVGHYGMVLPRFVDQALAGGPLIVYDDGQQVRCFGHVADIVGGVLELMHCPAAAGQVFNLGSDEAVTIRTLAERVVGLIDPKLEIEHLPYAQAYAPGFEDIRARVPDLTRIRNTIGYRPRHRLDDILREVIAWKREQRAASAFTS